MQVLPNKNRIVENGYWRRKNIYGSWKTERNFWVTKPGHSKTNPGIPQIRKLLPKIHPSLLRNCQTPQQSSKKRQKIWMDNRLSTGVWRIEKTLHGRTGLDHARSYKTIPNWMWRVQIRVRSSVDPIGFEWGPSPMCVYFEFFSPMERNYENYDWELLAIIRALEEWQHYIQGSPHTMTILSDHKNLTYYQEARKLNRRQARWSLYLSEFNIKTLN